MISCFLQHRETRKFRGKNTIIILVCALLVQFSCTEDLAHYTESTNCQINFQLQQSSSQNPSNTQNGLIFKKCVRKVCQSYKMNGLCRSQQEYNLEESICFRQCCGSSQFDFLSCNDYNNVHQIKERSSVGTIIAVLSISITGLLIAAIIFAVKYIKCCPKKNQHPEKNQFTDTQTQKNQILPNWKRCQFNNLYQCYECKQSGAFAMLPCGKIYHLKCLNMAQWTCTHCSSPISKIKLYCIVCLKYSIMVKVDKGEIIWEKVMEAYSWHPNRCYQYLEDELGGETDRKLTEATNVSP